MKKKTKFEKKFNFNDVKRGIIMILPVFIGLLIFYIIPFFQNIFYSFTDLNSFGKWQFVGMSNYQKILADEKFISAVKNTLIYTVFTVPLILIISMFIASLLNSKIKGIGIYRTLYFLPAVTMPAATAMIWKWLFNGQYGLVNQLFIKIGLAPQAWVADPQYARMSLIIVGVWMGLGMNIIYFLAGMQAIPKQYYEAAKLDGANAWTTFWKITLPSLKPTIFFVLVTSVIGAFQVFDIIFLMIPAKSLALDTTRSIVYIFYQYAVEFGQKGYGAAVATILFVMILIVTILQIILQKKWSEN